MPLESLELSLNVETSMLLGLFIKVDPMLIQFC